MATIKGGDIILSDDQHGEIDVSPNTRNHGKIVYKVVEISKSEILILLEWLKSLTFACAGQRSMFHHVHSPTRLLKSSL